MSTSFLIMVIILSIVVWIAVSREAVKATEKVNWRKMISLMGVGSLLTGMLVISLFQDIPFLK